MPACKPGKKGKGVRGMFNSRSRPCITLDGRSLDYDGDIDYQGAHMPVMGRRPAVSAATGRGR